MSELAIWGLINLTDGHRKPAHQSYSHNGLKQTEEERDKPKAENQRVSSVKIVVDKAKLTFYDPKGTFIILLLNYPRPDQVPVYVTDVPLQVHTFEPAPEEPGQGKGQREILEIMAVAWQVLIT
jgi:hypothetical protein